MFGVSFERVFWTLKEKKMANASVSANVTFPNVTFINIENSGLTLERAKEAAGQVANNRDSDALLLSWYDKKSGEEYPKVSRERDVPGWINYAKSR